MIIHLSAEGLILLQIVVASVLPVIVAYVTDSNASSALKTWVLIVLTAVADVLTTLLAKPDFDLVMTLISFFGMLFAAIAAHKGITSKPIVGVPLSGSDSPVAGAGLKIGAPSEDPPNAA